MSDNTTIANKQIMFLQELPADFDQTDPEIEAFVEAYLRPPAEYRAYIAERLASFNEDPLHEAA